MKPAWDGIAGWVLIVAAFALQLLRPAAAVDGADLLAIGLVVAGLHLVLGRLQAGGER